MNLNKTLTDIKIMKIELRTLHNKIMELVECEGCMKGPCIGRLKLGCIGYAFQDSVFLCNGHFYLDGCAMISGSAKSLPIEVLNNNGVYEINTPTLILKVQDTINSKSIPVGKKSWIK